MDPRYTEGAERVLILAAEVASCCRASHVQSVHLLWALAADESVAQHILSQFDVSHEDVAPLCRPESDGRQPSQNLHSSVEVLRRRQQGPVQNQESTPDWSAALRTVIDEATRQACQTRPTDAEIGTEHLLHGLVIAENSLRDFLRQRGLSEQSLLGHLSDSAEGAVEPIELDIEISGSDLGGTHTPQVSESAGLSERHARQDDGNVLRTSEFADVCRMMDAAANRAREGVRVVEDFVRFVMNDAYLTEQLKTFRHDLTEALRILPFAELLTARETTIDVGTRVTTDSESQRQSSVELVQANLKRLQEAVRTLEECSKRLASPGSRSITATTTSDLSGLPRRLEQLRYRAYTLEKSVMLTQHNGNRLAACHLYLLVTSSSCAAGIERVVRDAVTGGAGIVQLREKSIPDRQLLELAKQVRRWTREGEAIFIMNDRPDLAVLADADGVHVGQEELSVYDARRIVGPDRLVGVSTHTLDQARAAVRDGANYIGVGPVFGSRTKQFDSLAGLDFVRQVASEITLPWYAIGGIDSSNVNEALQAGASRIAVSNAVCAAPDPGHATRSLRERLLPDPGLLVGL